MKNSAEAAAEAPADEAPASGAAALGAVFPPALLDYVNTLLARQTREFELRLAEQKEELVAKIEEQKVTLDEQRRS